MTMPDQHFPDHVPPSDGERGDTAQRDESALIARVRAGDEAAFGMLVAAYVRRLTHFAYTIVRSSEAADDVVQTVFFELWERRAVLDGIVSLRAYLFRLVRNRAVDERRADAARARHRDVMHAEVVAETVPALVKSHEGAVLDAATVEAALQRLPEQRRLAVRLRFDGQLTHEEIGEVLEISAQAAKKLVSRGVQDLKNFFGVSP